jgi:hypothetical protein
MQQNSSAEVNCHAASQNILGFLWKPRFVTVFTRARKSPYCKPDEFAPDIYTVHFFKIQFNIFLLSTSLSSE